MASLAFMPFYPADFLGSPSVEALSLEAQGAYVRLLSRMWLAPGGTGRLPGDDRTLADLVGVRLDVWRRLRKELVKVIRFEGGEAFNDRLLIELAKAQAKYRLKVERKGKAKEAASEKVGRKSEESPKKVAGTSDFSTREVSDSKHLVQAELELQPQSQEAKDSGKRTGPKKVCQVRTYSQAFADFWNALPAKRGSKPEAADLFDGWIAGGQSAERLIQAAANYAEECRINGTEDRYIMHGTRFLSSDGQPWLTYLDGWAAPKPRGRNAPVDHEFRSQMRRLGIDPDPPNTGPPESGSLLLPPIKASRYARST